GTWGGVLLSSAIFGIAHAYQGRTGVLRTAIVGLMVAVLFVVSGSLWLAIVLHTAVDLYGGALGRLALESTGETKDTSVTPP
ncbi:MAG: CPBP family intramembrane metalloprotease, partial [Betaproteobacteria bacterium]|nr:CPBP family intramembrane metalloprotease [Betaproteobacteria bacterium]